MGITIVTGSKISAPRSTGVSPNIERPTVTHLSQQQIDKYVLLLRTSIEGLAPELAYRQMVAAYSAHWFETEPDSDLKSAVAGLLASKYGSRNTLWQKIARRDSSVLHLL